MKFPNIFEDVRKEITSKYWKEDIKDEYPDTVAGDTDSFFIELSKLVNKNKSENENLNTLEEFAKSLLDEHINNELLRQYLPNILNLDKEHIYLDLEYEALGRTYNLDAKKKYVYYMQKPKEKLDIKGLETERSDYPKLTREVLKNIIKMLVVELKPITEIESYIESVRKDFINRLEQWDISLARPVSYTKSISEYKKVPSHVIGMLLYNELVQDEVFRSGSKGYAFRIQVMQPKLSDDLYNRLLNIVKSYSKSTKIEWLVVPENFDPNILPEGIVVDIDQMIKFVLDDRVDLLLSGISRKTTEDDLLFDL